MLRVVFVSSAAAREFYLSPPQPFLALAFCFQPAPAPLRSASSDPMSLRFSDISDTSHDDLVRAAAALSADDQARLRRILNAFEAARQETGPPPAPVPVPRLCTLPCSNPACTRTCGRPIRASRSRPTHDRRACKDCHRAGLA